MSRSSRPQKQERICPNCGKPERWWQKHFYIAESGMPGYLCTPTKGTPEQ